MRRLLIRRENSRNYFRFNSVSFSFPASLLRLWYNVIQFLRQITAELRVAQIQRNLSCMNTHSDTRRRYLLIAARLSWHQARITRSLLFQTRWIVGHRAHRTRWTKWPAFCWRVTKCIRKRGPLLKNASCNEREGKNKILALDGTKRPHVLWNSSIELRLVSR